MIDFSKYRHVIWDWNGTLLDDVWLCVDVMNGLLQKRGMKLLTVDEYREIFTFPVIEYYRLLGFNFEVESFEKVGTEFIMEYEKRRLESQLQPYTLEVLEKIRKLKITQSVLSAYKQETLNELLNHFGLIKYFNFILGLDNHYADSKLENGKKLIQLLELKPKEVLFIGDTLHDFEVANEIGTDCVLISAGHQAKSKLVRYHIKVFNSLKSLL